MDIGRVLFVVAMGVAVVASGGLGATGTDTGGISARGAAAIAESADGTPMRATKVTYPASREAVLESLAGNVVLACRLPDLQAAAELNERQCRSYVLAAKDACKAKARVLIPELIVQSQAQFGDELRTYLDCLIPPTNLAAPERSGPDVLARSVQHATLDGPAFGQGQQEKKPPARVAFSWRAGRWPQKLSFSGLASNRCTESMISCLAASTPSQPSSFTHLPFSRSL